jgi:hypothetical protein
MTIVYRRVKGHGFAAGDTETGHAVYAYANTDYSERAKTEPLKVAHEILKLQLPSGDCGSIFRLKNRPEWPYPISDYSLAVWYLIYNKQPGEEE